MRADTADGGGGDCAWFVTVIFEVSVVELETDWIFS